MADAVLHTFGVQGRQPGLAAAERIAAAAERDPESATAEPARTDWLPSV
ncbi:hypothetical protein ABZ614_23900 [Streptomyces sp. NPDC013178]